MLCDLNLIIIRQRHKLGLAQTMKNILRSKVHKNMWGVYNVNLAYTVPSHTCSVHLNKKILV